MAKNKEILKSKRALMDLPSVKSAKLIETHIHLLPQHGV